MTLTPAALASAAAAAAAVASCGQMMMTLNALGDQSFNIGFFLGGITLAEEDLDIVAGGFEGILEAGLILDPARLVLGGKNDTDGELAFGGCSSATIESSKFTGLVVTRVDQGSLDIGSGQP